MVGIATGTPGGSMRYEVIERSTCGCGARDHARSEDRPLGRSVNVGRSQFSLRYLLVEMALIAVAIAVGRLLFQETNWEGPREVFLAWAFYAATGAALGGVVHRIWLGAILGIIIGPLLVWFF